MALNLSTLLSGGPYPYLEFGWVTAPNTAGQSITANTITTLTIDTEVVDTGNFGSISSNQITLAAGTYYFKAIGPVFFTSANDLGCVFSLFNVTDSTYVSRASTTPAASVYNAALALEAQFTIAGTKTFDLRLICSAAASIRSGGLTAFTLATAGADQRTTIKLWKLA